MKDFHQSIRSSDMESIKQLDGKHAGKEVTDDHIAAALFMVYGEEGIDRLCAFSKRWTDASNRRLVASAEPAENLKNQNQRRNTDCEGADVGYPGTSKMDPKGVYGAFVSGRLAPLMDERAGANSRTSPAKMITEGQIQLDEALEGEYTAVLCGAYFSAVTDLIAIPDFVVEKQGQILDGINGLTCGVAERTMQVMQGTMRGLLNDGMKHNELINRAETTAMYENTMIIADKSCAINSEMISLDAEGEAIKRRLNFPQVLILSDKHRPNHTLKSQQMWYLHLSRETAVQPIHVTL